jgi:hypothetical protein
LVCRSFPGQKIITSIEDITQHNIGDIAIISQDILFSPLLDWTKFKRLVNNKSKFTWKLKSGEKIKINKGEFTGYFLIFKVKIIFKILFLEKVFPVFFWFWNV